MCSATALAAAVGPPSSARQPSALKVTLVRLLVPIDDIAQQCGGFWTPSGSC
jgi:hypothetical protein